MGIEVRIAASRDEFARGIAIVGQYFGMPPMDAEGVERVLRRLPLERMVVALDDGKPVGSGGALPFSMSVPGGSIACAGITAVGVEPTHRRRGVLRSLMRRLLDDAHQRGDPIAALWASEESIYGRFGFGTAVWTGEISLPRMRSEFREPFKPSARVRLASPQEAYEACARIWSRLSQQRPGFFSRSEPWWRERVLVEPPERGKPPTPRQIALLELGGEVRGYALFRRKPTGDDVSAETDLEVREALACDREATRELWRWLFDMDLVATVFAHKLPLDHPLLHLLRYPRHLRLRLTDALWVRLLDVGAALSSRAYAQEGRLVFEVRDPFCPWNEGRWKLEDGRAQRTQATPDLSLDVEALGAAYFGGVTFQALAAAFRVEELTPGALLRADGLFRVAAQPWCPELF